MVPRIYPALKAAGFWSAAAATFFSIAYDVGQLAEWLGWLGSKGGPESSSTPLGIVVLLTPSLLLGPSFLIAMASVDEIAPTPLRIWSRIATLFATAYLALIAINYYVQLTWVGPRLSAGRIAGMEAFLFVPFDSFLYAVDILGYGFMSLACLFAGFVFPGERTARRMLIATGLLIPFITLQMFWHWLIWIAAAWAVTFPAAMWSLASIFRRAEIRDDTIGA